MASWKDMSDSLAKVADSFRSLEPLIEQIREAFAQIKAAIPTTEGNVDGIAVDCVVIPCPIETEEEEMKPC